MPISGRQPARFLSSFATGKPQGRGSVVPRAATTTRYSSRPPVRLSPAHRLAAARRLFGEQERVLRLMQEDNLLSLGKAKYVLTTDSGHDLPVYPNLTRRLTLTDINQLWLADITYIRLRSEFVFLAVVLDAYSRRVIGWELGRSLHAALATKALALALHERTWQPGVLIHHSDRGVQYASREYTSLLVEHEIR